MSGEYADFHSCQHGICGCCGTGRHTNYRHDPNCLSNLPEHTPKLIANWKCGFEGRPFTPGLLDTQIQKQAWEMGVALARKNESSARTTKSLEEAVEIAEAMTQ